MSERGKKIDKNGQLSKYFNSAKTITDKLIGLRRRFDQNVHANITDDNGNTPLHLAIYEKRAAFMKLLFKWSAYVNVPNNNGDMPLHYAVREKRKSIAALLLDKDADVNAHGIDGVTPLLVAVSNRDTSMVEFLLSRGADLNIRDIDNETPLHFAMRNNIHHIVELLIIKGADVNAQGKNNETPLHIAVSKRYTFTVDFLLNRGADVNAQDINNQTPLHWAVNVNDTYIAEYLLKRGANINARNNNNETPLHYAKWQNIHMAELLINKGADINARVISDATPLHVAVVWKNISLLELLLNRGADVNAREIHNQTPLHWAVVENNMSIVECLLERGADVNVQDIDNETPLHYAVRNNIYIVKHLINKSVDENVQEINNSSPSYDAFWISIYILELLINNGADVNAQIKIGRTPLHIAMTHKAIPMSEILFNRSTEVNSWNINNLISLSFNNMAITKFLIDKGAELNAQGIDNLTPLHFVHYNTYLAEFLINKGADVNAQDKNGVRPIHAAVIGNHTSLIELLLNRGADVNVKNKVGVTPLHYAALRDMSVVKLLLCNGAKVDVEDRSGITPLYYAMINSKVDIVTLLINNGVDTTLENENGFTPLFFASLFRNYESELLNVLWTAEKQANHNYYPHQYSLPTYNMHNYKVKLMSTNNSGFTGQLYETKLVSLIFIRTLNHELIEHDSIFLGANIDRIGAMDDICVIFCIRGQNKPVVLFIQIKETRKLLTDEALWNDEGDFSLQKYFESYLLIMERFQVGNKDPMFEGQFSDVNCYFVLYTPAKENLTKKKTVMREITIMHDLINTGHNIEPIQYCYDEADINRLAEVAVAVRTNKKEQNKEEYFCDLNLIACDKALAKEFFNRLLFYHSQSTEDGVERKAKKEIGKHYNNENETLPFKFEIHSNAIFMRSHNDIQKWWIQKNAAPYLSGLDDFFKRAKKTYIYEVCLTILSAIDYFGIDFNLTFYYYTPITQSENYIKSTEDLNTMISRLFTTISDENILIPVNISLQHEVVNMLISYSSQDANPDNDLLENQSFEYSKRAGTSEAFGVLLRIKMLCLVFLRMLYHKQIAIDPPALLAAKLSGISVMNDICLRCRVKDQQRPVVLFMHLKHVGDPEKGKLTDDDLWSESQDSSLLKHFAGYITIKERYQSGNKDTFFQEKICDVDTYFGLYTTAKESLSKKKIGKGCIISKVLHDLINTNQNTEVFQYDYDEADIDHLISVMVKNEILKLGTVFSECLRRPAKFNANLIVNNLIKRYHVVMAREVLQPCDEQPDIDVYRLWQFRSDFFNSLHEHLVILRKCIYKKHENITYSDKTLKIKLPLAFGNLDMIFGRKQAQQRIKAIARNLMRLMELNLDQQIVEIREEDVGPGKTIEEGILELNGGLASAVGNLLVFDDASKTFMFNVESNDLPQNAALLLRELKSDTYKPINKYLKDYRFKILVTGFPKTKFDSDEYDMLQARDFFNKFWFFCDQAREDVVENILKEEVNKKYINNQFKLNHIGICRNISDFISSYSYNEVQKWWLEINEPYLSRACELFERAELECINNLLQTVINYMYLRKINSIDIDIKRFKKDNLSGEVYSHFKRITTKLFSLYNPYFNESIHFSDYSNSTRCETSSLRLMIHPELRWVALHIKSTLTLNTDFYYFVTAKVDFSNGHHPRAKDGFKINEYIYRERLWVRDCFEEEMESKWIQTLI